MRTTMAALSSLRADASLVESVHINRKYIESVGDKWLARGFQTYSIWGDELLFCWPTSAWNTVRKLKDEDITLFVPIKQGRVRIGRVAITGGTKTPLAQSLLETEQVMVDTYLTMRTSSFEEASRELMAHTQLKAEIDMAARIQQHLLPETLPHVSGLDIYARSCPAKRVGGDFYDFFFAKDCWLFSVGDISGKGFPAALLMVMVRVVLRTAARSLATYSPGDVLMSANENLYDDLTDTGLLATAFVGCYHPTNGQISYTNAAHSPVIYYPKGGQARFLAADMIPLGVSPTCTSPTQILPFEFGDLLIVATDGFNECFNLKGEMFGNERLLQAVNELAHFPASQIGGELFRTIATFSAGTSQSDDQTLVIIKKVS